MANNRSQTWLRVPSLVIEHTLSHSLEIVLATGTKVHLSLSQLVFAKSLLRNNKRAWAIVKFAHFSDIHRFVYLVVAVSPFLNLLHIQMMREIIFIYCDRWVSLISHYAHRTRIIILQYQLHLIIVILFARILSLTCVQIDFARESKSLRTHKGGTFKIIPVGHGNRILLGLQRFDSFCSLGHIPDLWLLQDLVVYGNTTVSLKFIIFVWRIDKSLVVHLDRLFRHFFYETADSIFIVIIQLFVSQHSFDGRLLRRLFLILLLCELFLIFMVVENRHI